MNKLLILGFLVLLFSVSGSAQADLPEIGTLADIKGKTNVYIVADGESLKAILKKLKGSPLVVVTKATEADFFLEYKTIARDQVAGSGMTLETGQIDVYIYRDKTKVIAWSDSKVAGGWSGGAAGQLTGNFIKAFSKSKK